jgi:ribosome-binding protein aMBF1 (putative translation factor)
MPAVSRGSCLHWLATVCREAREEANRGQVHIAARLGVNQATIARFERAHAWPRDPDQMAQAYADELGVEAVELWAEAIRRWHDEQT